MRSAGRTRALAREAQAFVGLLARLTKWGMPLSQAIEIASKALKDSRLKETAERIRKQVEGGTPLSQALSAESQLFPASYVEAIAEGEKSGSLPSVLKAISEEIEESIEAEKLIRRVSLYRTSAVSGAVAIILVGVFGIVPVVLSTFRAYLEVWEGFDAVLPHTVSLFWPTARFASEHPFTIVLLLCGILGLVILALRGGSLRAANLRIFCGVVGRNLKWGMTAREALTAARKAVPSGLLEREVAKVADNVEGGASLSESMNRSRLFPRPLVRAAAAGESRGNLADAFLDMADSYRQESERTREKLAGRAVAVPALFMAVFVVFCVISTAITTATFFRPLFGPLSSFEV